MQVTVGGTNGTVVFNTPLPGQPGALSGASTSVVIPANTLPPGLTFNCNLLAARPGLPNTTYATGIPALSKTTGFILATRPAPPPTPLAISWKPGVGATLRFEAEADRRYHLQASAGLAGWNDLQVTTNHQRGYDQLH